MSETTPPTFEEICAKVTALFQTSVGNKKLIQPGVSLSACGFDSLDLIEASFTLEDFFGFQFNSENPIETLDQMLGGNRLVRAGLLTEIGRQVLLERMPELRKVGIPTELRIQYLPASFTIETFARLVHEFYVEVAAVAAVEGRTVVYRNMLPYWAETQTRVPVPDGDELVKRWAQTKARELAD